MFLYTEIYNRQFNIKYNLQSNVNSTTDLTKEHFISIIQMQMDEINY
jgi:hypothetical protein